MSAVSSTAYAMVSALPAGFPLAASTVQRHRAPRIAHRGVHA